MVPTPQLARPLGDSVIYHAPQMGPRDLSNALWSIAAASAASMAVKGEAPAKLQQQQQRSRSALSNHSTVKLVSVLCTALEADGMAYANGQDVANVLWALAKLRVMPSASLMRVLQNALIRTARSLRPQEVANAMWGLASILGSGKAGNKDPAISLPSSAATISSRPSDDERWQFSSMTRGSVILPASAMHVQSHAPCFSALRTRALEVGAQLQAGHWAQLLWAHAHCPAARLQPAAAVPSTSQQRSASVSELLESAGRYLHVLLGHEGCVSVHEAATLAWALGTLR